ncbi:hypothetical protein C2G38_2146977 [Gigaspora rosea]|uniref:Ion transport domain-containing protein n=1 Tax=Gigaspora rosea TaxID=44941 RepID=A0A397UEJ3_9GLOM|nr:hypothetical protein C2G38_2146977 [Gigaspora rosea]
MEKQPQRTQETFNFLNNIDLEIPEEEIPEILDKQFPVLALNFGKLSSYEIQTLIKYKKKFQESIRPLRRIEHKIQTIEKSYKGFKYLSIFNKAERKIIAQKFGENPTIAELSQDNTILHKFQNTIFEFEIHKSSTNKLTYLKLRLPKDQTQINISFSSKMSSSKSEEQLFEDQNQIKIPIDDAPTPHEGKEISNYVFSPRMQNIATLSEKDKSIVVWTITELIVKYANALNANDIQVVLDTYESFSDFRFEDIIARHQNTLIGISDYKQIILKLKRYDDFSFVFETFDEELHNFCFIGSGEEERLFFSGPHHDKRSYRSYVLNPYNTHTLDKSSDTYVLQDIYPVTYQNYKSIGSIISDYVIKIDMNKLSIQRLSKNKDWKIFIERKERYYNSAYTYFNVREIRRFIQDILDKYESNESNQILTLNDSKRKEYPGDTHTWIIEYNKDGDGIWEVKLKAKIGSDKEIESRSFYLDDGIFANKVLENGDILLVFSSCIQIYAINLEKNSEKPITLIYCWNNNSKQIAKKPEDFIFDLLSSFKKNLKFRYFDDFEILPPPNFYIRMEVKNRSSIYWLDYKKTEFLKLYGIELIRKILREFKFDIFYNYYYDHRLIVFNNNEIYDFTLMIGQIASILREVEIIQKNQRITEKFLSETDLLVGNVMPKANHEAYDTSLLFNLQHYGTYVTSRDLFNTSRFNLLSFWISEKWSYFKNSYPQLYSILVFPYSILVFPYSLYLYNPIYPQETVILIFPLLNFATYPKEFSYRELFYLQDNPFTLLLDAPEYYKWWNIKALINFKWNTYGRLYYFIMWTIYSVFMCCFLIVSSIPEHKVSWNIQVILLISTVFLGIFHFTWEFRQFIHMPKTYITSPWNCIDLAAILVPTIISILWLHDKVLPIWAITIAAFLLELKFLLFFRAIEYFGIYFAIMIGVAKKVFSFLVVLGIMVLAFAHSLHLLLRPTSEYSYDQPSFTNDANNPWNLVSTYKFILPNGTVEKSSLIETPDDSTNLFSQFSTSILAVYFMLTGDLSSVSSWALKNNWTLAFLLFLFSFFTTIYLLNLFITLLGNAIDDRNNEESFLQLRGEILSEIELFWMLPYQRRKKNWFPEILYYKASVNELKKYINNNIEDKSSIHPDLLKIAKIEDSEKELKEKIEDSENELKKMIEDSEMELKKQINEALDKINKLIELTEKNKKNNNSSD